MKNHFYHVVMVIDAVLLSGCHQSTQYDLSALKPYSFELEETFQKTEKLTPPYAALFKTLNGELLYIASEHAADLKSPTFQWIGQAINRFSPDFIILEGINDSSPKDLMKHIREVCIPSWRCGENLYGAYLASMAGIPFVGGEPDDSQMFRLLEIQGYTLRDVVFFYFTGMVPQYRLKKQIRSMKNLEVLFPTFVSKFIGGSTDRFQDYTAWLKDKLNRDVMWKELIDPNFTAPIEIGHYIQRLSARIGIMRDQHIVKTILQSMSEHKKVLAIYGCSHYPTQKDALIKYLGKPIYLPTRQSFVKHNRKRPLSYEN